MLGTSQLATQLIHPNPFQKALRFSANDNFEARFKTFHQQIEDISAALLTTGQENRILEQIFSKQKDALKSLSQGDKTGNHLRSELWKILMETFEALNQEGLTPEAQPDVMEELAQQMLPNLYKSIADERNKVSEDL